MIITDFRNALPQLGYNAAQIVGPEARKANYKGKILLWIGRPTYPGCLSC